MIYSYRELVEGIIYRFTDEIHGTNIGTYKGCNYNEDIRENVLYFWTANGSISIDQSEFIEAEEI